MKKICRIHSLVFVMGILYSCHHPQDTLFTEVPSSNSHIDFTNNITEDTAFNILTYEYLYNGGGVAVGDVNNDGLPDLVFSGNMAPSKLYLNKGNFEFEDVTIKTGFAGKEKWKTGVVMADVNGDGLLDIYACYSGPGTDDQRSNELYINQGVKNGVPVFAEQSKQYGLDAKGTYSTTATFFDVDNDGDLDMLLVNHADMFYNPFFETEKLRRKRHPKFGNRLYRNDQGKFTDISEAAHITGSGINFGLGAGISDINNDGWPDIYVTNDYDERDFLYLNNHDGTFTEVLDRAAGHISEFAMGCDIADYNNDLRPDIMVLDMLPEDNHRQKLLKGADAYEKYTMRFNHGFHKQQMRNTLQLNNGNDSSGIPILSEVGNLAGIAATDWSWSPLFADFDNDGWKDLFISNGIYKDITNLDFVKYTSGYSNHFIDHKGEAVNMWQLVKEMPSTPLTSYFYRNNHDLTFSNVSANWGLTKNVISNGTAYADLDNDGDLDLIVNCLGSKARILKNNTSEKKHANFLRIRLKGNNANSNGIGAKVILRTTAGSQLAEQYPDRGFQSSVDPVIHFGTGADTVISSVIVKWPGGGISTLNNLKANTTITVDQSGSVDAPDTVAPLQPAFADITSVSGIHYNHQSSAFVDFKISPLLPYQTSKTGPCIVKGDLNGDGLVDLLIGGNPGKVPVVFMQSANGTFRADSARISLTSDNGTVTDAVFFDADGDGDNDLYLVFGGSEHPAGSKKYQDKLLINDGRGYFSLSESALPDELVNSTCVKVGDLNHDGRPDLFVGGGVFPGRFPMAEKSFVLINNSNAGKPAFVMDTRQTDSAFTHMGLVSDAVWLDLNKDGWPELVCAGPFGPVRIFENKQGILQNRTKEYGLDSTNGWWTRIVAADFDHDGDTDLVCGNLGDNTLLTASLQRPLTITYADFNNDGVIDPVLSVYNKDKTYPYFSRDEMLDQMPGLQKRFSRYADYADAQLVDIFSENQLRQASIAEIKTLNSTYFNNLGNGKFGMSALPTTAQVSMVNGLVVQDVNRDGNPDLILSGNFYPMRVQLGPLDASIGLVLLGDGKGHFVPRTYSETGLYIPGDVRCMTEISVKGHSWIIAGKCNNPAQVIQIKN